MTPIEVFWDSLDQPLRIGNQVFAFSWSTIILEFLLPLILLALVSLVFWKWFKRYLSKSTLDADRKSRIRRAAKIGLQILFVIVLLLLGSRFLEDRILRFIDDIFNAIRSPFFKSGGTEISILTLVLAVPVFYLARLAGRAGKLAFERSRLFTHHLDEARRFSMANLIRYTILTIALIVGLSIIGVDLSAIAVILGVLGVGIGFGLQQLVASFFSGLVIVMNRTIKEGDTIRFQNDGKSVEGKVSQIRMLSSTVTSNLNEAVIVPNSSLFHHAVHNLSVHESTTLAETSLTVSYDENVEKVLELLGSVARRCPFWNGSAEPASQVAALGPDGVEIRLFWAITKSTDRIASVAWVNQEILKEFKSGKIKFATRQH